MSPLARWIAVGTFGLAGFLGTTSAAALPKIVTHKRAPENEKLLVAVAARDAPPGTVELGRAVELGGSMLDDDSLEESGPDQPLHPYLEALHELPEEIEATTVLWLGRNVSVRASTSKVGVESALDNKNPLKLLRQVELAVRDKRVEIRVLLSSKDDVYTARCVTLVPLHEKGAFRWGSHVEGRVDVPPDFDSIKVNGSAGITLELNGKAEVGLPAGVTLRPAIGAGLRGGHTGLWVIAQVHAEVRSEDWFAEEPVRLRFEAGFGTPGFKTSTTNVAHRLHAQPTFAARVSAPIPFRPNWGAGVEASRQSGESKVQGFVSFKDGK